MAATRRISVRLAGKEYPMTIPQAEEEKYRRAARDINSLIAARGILIRVWCCWRRE